MGARTGRGRGRKMKETVLIIGSAPEADTGYVRAVYDALEKPYVICADGGARYAQQYEIPIDLLIGDGDSLGGLPACEYIRLPTRKDDTDSQACVREAFARGGETIVFVCVSGGRADHYLSNLAQLESIAEAGRHGVIYDACNRIRFFGPGKVTVARDPAYHYVGIIPLDYRVDGVTLCGFSYPLENATLRREDMISMSNELVEERGTITVKRGRYYLIESDDRR